MIKNILLSQVKQKRYSVNLLKCLFLIFFLMGD